MGEVIKQSFQAIIDLLKGIDIPYFHISVFSLFIGLFVVTFSIRLFRYILGASEESDAKSDK